MCTHAHMHECMRVCWQCEAHVRTQEHERLAHARMHGLARINAWRTHALQEETAGGRGAYVLRGEGGSSRVGS
jgi:hypothetical protein